MPIRIWSNGCGVAAGLRMFMTSWFMDPYLLVAGLARD
jgi:hypothetical protein